MKKDSKSEVNLKTQDLEAKIFQNKQEIKQYTMFTVKCRLNV